MNVESSIGNVDNTGRSNNTNDKNDSEKHNNNVNNIEKPNHDVNNIERPNKNFNNIERPNESNIGRPNIIYIFSPNDRNVGRPNIPEDEQPNITNNDLNKNSTFGEARLVHSNYEGMIRKLEEIFIVNIMLIIFGFIAIAALLLLAMIELARYMRQNTSKNEDLQEINFGIPASMQKCAMDSGEMNDVKIQEKCKIKS